MEDAASAQTETSGAHISVALGGGGARGISHVLVIEALDELGVRPFEIAGTSIGAVIGAAWAAGMTGADIRAHILALTRNRTEFMGRMLKARAGRFTDILGGKFSNPMLLNAEKLLDVFWPLEIPDRFEQLGIPLSVVATDYYGRRECRFHEGPLAPAVAASMAIPGLIRPVLREGVVLYDGGIVNPLPFMHLMGKDTYVIACDVTGGPTQGKRATPQPFEALFGALQLMQSSITAQVLKTHRPDLLLHPKVDHFRLLDFFRSARILAAAEPMKDQVKRAVAKRLEKA